MRTKDVHSLGDAPFANGLAGGTGLQDIDQAISPCREERTHEPLRSRRKLAKKAFEEVRQRVEGDHAGDARLIGRSANREASAERDAHEGYAGQGQAIEDGTDGAMPVGRHGKAAVLERSALAWAFKRHDVKAPIPHGRQDWEK